MSANCGVTGPLIDKDEVLGDNCLRAVAELLARTSRLEKRLWDPNKETRIHPDQLPRRVNYAAQCLRDWGLNAEADKMMDLWGDFFRAWTDGLGTPCDESLVNRLGKLNQWLGDTLRQWVIAAGQATQTEGAASACAEASENPAVGINGE